MHHVQLRRAAADHHEDAAGHGPVELQEPQVPLAVDRTGPHDRDPLAAPGSGRDGELGFEFGALIDIAGPERIGLAGRRVGDVPVHASGRAMHHPLTIETARCLEHILCTAYVDFTVVAVGMSRGAEHCCDVVDLIATACRRDHIIEGGQLPDTNVYAGGGERLGFRPVSHERAHTFASSREPASQVSAGEAGGASDEDGAWHDAILRRLSSA